MKMQVNLQKFKKFKAEMQKDEWEARVGFLGDEKNDRPEGEMTNAEIAALHHFGSPTKKLPKRNWAIGFDMKDKTAVIYKVMENSLKKAIEKGSFTTQDKVNALILGGIEGEDLIKETIISEGFGTFAPLSEKTKQMKTQNKDKILIETGQLVDSAMSKVVKKNV